MLNFTLFVDNGSGSREDRIQKEIGPAVEKQLGLAIMIPGLSGIIRWVTVGIDGRVVVEDVPQATGMDADETYFIYPEGRMKCDVAPPRRHEEGGFNTPDPMVTRTR